MSNLLVDFSNAIADAVEHAGRSVVAIHEGGQSGVSGTIWRQGVIVASEHTLHGRDEVTVTLPAGAKATATVAGRDPGTDLAALRLSAADTPAQSSATGDLKIGHIVLAVGRRPSGGLTATHGMVSATGAAFRTWSGGRIDRSLRLDLMPYPGFSGGPLVDATGRVLGINTSGARRSVLTIPRETVERVVEQLLTKGRVARGYLGVGVQPIALPPALAHAGNDRGLLVITVADGGPAQTAGLIVGDILVSGEGQSLNVPSDLHAALDSENVGKPYRIRLLRGGSPTEITVTVGERGRQR
jgi:S1-C subfamily serine protease